MSFLADGGRTLRTVRHIPPRQLAALVKHRLRRPRLRIAAAAPAPLVESAAGALAGLGPVGDDADVINTAERFAAGELSMLGRVERWLGEWQQVDVGSPLWRYHLHYHDVLADVAWLARTTADPRMLSSLAAALSSWIDTYARSDGRAWDAYPTSVRCVNWVRILAWAGSALPPSLVTELRRLQAVQLLTIRARLERHLRGNHLLRNACALVIGSECLGGAAADAVRQPARQLFFEELAAQVDADGLHEERSPMYHVRALRDALEVYAVLQERGVGFPEDVTHALRRMTQTLSLLRRPDGSLHLLGDSAHDHRVGLGRLETLVRRLAMPSGHTTGLRVLRHAGLLIADRGRDRLFMTFAAPAPAHQPGHAHADGLSLEYDIAGVPLLIDPGTTGYDGDPLRPYFRSTRAHNTVAVGGRDQSEMWATFRVGGRAQVLLREVLGTTTELRLAGVCRPHFARDARHEREVWWDDRTLLVDDRVVGWAFGFEANWHVHPEWQVRREGDILELRRSCGRSAILTIDGADDVSLHRGDTAAPGGWYSAGFGRAIPCWTIRASVRTNHGRCLRTVVEKRT